MEVNSFFKFSGNELLYLTGYIERIYTLDQCRIFSYFMILMQELF